LLEDKFSYNTAIVLTDEQKVNKTEKPTMTDTFLLRDYERWNST